ncbi:alpha/beta hydrolase family protein [Kineococcus sp. SYSU DK003]|uniref:alpha/beta hydrolase family protein n=1 Tax=Kineococcus sp. SYSU DK003 TaxID=3383124 RepID=UPI003D7F0E84
MSDGDHWRAGVHPDLTALLRRAWPLFGQDDEALTGPAAGQEVSRRLRAAVGIAPGPADPAVRVEGEWVRDGLHGRELSWEAGFGPRVHGRLVRPAGDDPLPGAIWFHCHGGVKRFGLDKLADGAAGRPAHPRIARIREELYGGRAPAEELARTGRAVLVHDAFGWGSRRVPLEAFPARTEAVAALELAALDGAGAELDEEALYDVHAGPAEDATAKALGVLGTSWTGMVAREDLLAVEVLGSLPGIAPGGVELIGFSGGGARAAITSALSPDVRSAVVTCMVTTLAEVLPAHLHSHTWALMTPGLGRVGDWPDVVAAAAPRPLLVQFGERDALFPPEGMRRAHEELRKRYAAAGAPEAYHGAFHDAPHSCGTAVQQEAFAWLDSVR